MSDTAPQAGELRLDPESIEAIARRLAELLGSGEGQRPRKQLISAEAIEWWGVSRRWVYENAKRLGVRRIGTGAVLGCASIPTRLPSNSASRPGASADGPMRGDCRRLAAIAGPTRFPGAAELWSVGKPKSGRGDAANAPRPGAEGGPPAR